MNSTKADSNLSKRLSISLLVLRVTISWFLLQWAVEKFVKPEITTRIFEFFYNIPIDVNISPVIGGIQALIVLGFLAGFMKTWTYALVLAMHGASTLVTWRSLVMPFAEDSNHLFITGVPVLAACFVLFYLREYDTLFTIGNRKAKIDT